MPTLYTTPRSANGRKPLAVARHLGVDLEVSLVDVYKGEGRTPEFLAINPAGKVPALVDGDFVLTESNAILVYLAEAYGDFALWSREPRRRADLARWLFWESSTWQPALIPVLRTFVAKQLGLVEPSTPVLVDWTDAHFVGAARHLDAHLGEREFLVDALSVADFAVAGMMTYVARAQFPAENYPAIARWYARVAQLEAWASTRTETFGEG